MNVKLNILPEFHWTQQPNSERQKKVEEEILITIHDVMEDICHPDAIIILLDISGPLDTNLKGIVRCKKCDKNLMTFEGDDRASNLKLIKIE